MRSILTLVVSSFLLLSCGLPQFPKFPSTVKNTYVIDIDPQTKEVSCAQFNIMSTNPIIVKFDKFVDLLECQAVEGFRPEDTVKVKNYIDEVQRYSTQVRCKLK
jgi:hypothetical protein